MNRVNYFTLWGKVMVSAFSGTLKTVLMVKHLIFISWKTGETSMFYHLNSQITVRAVKKEFLKRNLSSGWLKEWQNDEAIGRDSPDRRRSRLLQALANEIRSEALQANRLKKAYS